MDGIPFHPYYTVKDIMGAVACLILLAFVLFFIPEFGGWFLEAANFTPADPLKTPEHIVPVWYFTPYYAILRAIPDKITGVVAMGGAVLIFLVLPWIDRHPVKSIRYRSVLFKLLLLTFAVTFVVLGYLGTQPPTKALAELGFRFGELYFSFFLMLWWYSRDRSAGGALVLAIFLLLLVLVFDWIRGFSALTLYSLLMPIVFYAIFLLLPAVAPTLNESKPVPERVT